MRKDFSIINTTVTVEFWNQLSCNLVYSCSLVLLTRSATSVRTCMLLVNWINSFFLFCHFRCYNCGDFGNHLAAKCPHGPLPKRCHYCKAEDHLIADCSLREQTGNDSQDSSGHKDQGDDGGPGEGSPHNGSSGPAPSTSGEAPGPSTSSASKTSEGDSWRMWKI